MPSFCKGRAQWESHNKIPVKKSNFAIFISLLVSSHSLDRNGFEKLTVPTYKIKQQVINFSLYQSSLFIHRTLQLKDFLYKTMCVLLNHGFLVYVKL